MDPQTIKQTAAATLEGANSDPKKLALVHTGVMVLFSLAVSLISHFLDVGIDATGGLSGIAMRSMLESIRVVLSLAGTVLMPFWQIGFVYAALCYSRKETVSTSHLTEGFRRFGPVLRLNLFFLLIAMGVMMASSYISTTIFMFSPLSNGLTEAMENILQSGDVTVLTDEMVMGLMPHMGGLLAVNLIVILLVGLPFYYRFRMSQLALMNGAPGALAAMRESTRLTHRRRMQLLRFDLSFWWYFLIQGLIAVVAYGDTILASLGVTLPINGDLLFWILLLLHSALTLLFARKYNAYYHTAYAHYYEQLRQINAQYPTNK